jgi:hypothetical protein
MKLCKKGYEAAKRKFKVYPSAYANIYAAKICNKKQKTNEKTKVNYKKNKLKRWIDEKWVDVCSPTPKSSKTKRKTYKPCGRGNGDKRKYPYCRPSKRVTKDTPVTVYELSEEKIKSMCNKKRKLPNAKRKAPYRVKSLKKTKK